MNDDELKRSEKRKMIIDKIKQTLPWIVVIVIGFLVVNDWRVPGVHYSPRRWAETMSQDEYVDEFEENDIAEQFAPDTITTVDGAPLDQLYNCYEFLGGYHDPVLQPIIDELGQPIIWTGDTVPAMSEFGTYDLTGKQIRLYVHGEDIFAGFQCPPNAHLMRGQ